MQDADSLISWENISYIQILWFDELVVNVYEFAQFEFLEEC